jgi:hypothetical protein
MLPGASGYSVEWRGGRDASLGLEQGTGVFRDE